MVAAAIFRTPTSFHETFPRAILAAGHASTKQGAVFDHTLYMFDT
jgi:hypothetical protein